METEKLVGGLRHTQSEAPVVEQPSERGIRYAVAAASAGSFVAVAAAVQGMPSPFLWHPILMVAGYAVFMSLGVLPAMRGRQSESGASRVRQLSYHMWTQIAALCCLCGGLYAIYANKQLLGKPHLLSLHARAGVAVLLLSLAVPLAGSLSFRTLGMSSFFEYPTVVKLKAHHRFWGAVAIFCGCAVCISGVVKSVEGRIGHVAVVSLGVVAGGQVALSLIRSNASRLPSI